MDTSVAPGDDFFSFANGGWFKSTPIPADRSGIGVGATVTEEANRRTAELIRNAKGSRVGNYFAAYMDEKTIESRGTKALDSELRRIASLGDKQQLASWLGADLRADVD